MSALVFFGKQIAIPADELAESGNYKIKFNGEELPSGVYFVLITAEDTKSKQVFRSPQK